MIRKTKIVCTVRENLNLPIAILLDTKGPEYRIKTFKNGKSGNTDLIKVETL